MDIKEPRVEPIEWDQEAAKPRSVRKPLIPMFTTEQADGAIKERLGLVRASTVRARHIGSDIGASLKGIVGGRIGGYEKLLHAAREEVLQRLSDSARDMGADAVIALRMQTSDIMQGATEVLAYGTAVKCQ